MNTYEERKARKVARLKNRAAKNRDIAKNNGMDLYSEEKSGIPLGQPILVGHHSEKKHRKHVQRIHNRVRKGFEAADKANECDRAIEAIENRTAIDSDNPEALHLIEAKIEKMEAERIENRKKNQLLRSEGKLSELIPGWWFTNRGAEINRLKKRHAQLKNMVSTEFSVQDHEGARVTLEDGCIVIRFAETPSEEIRTKLKRSPLAFKWSPMNKFWCRKHTPTTNSSYFKNELQAFINEVKNVGSESNS